MVSFMEDYKDIIEEGCKINEANESAFSWSYCYKHPNNALN